MTRAIYQSRWSVSADAMSCAVTGDGEAIGSGSPKSACWPRSSLVLLGMVGVMGVSVRVEVPVPCGMTVERH